MLNLLTPRGVSGDRAGLHLPDPAAVGPYRPFASDPGWSEAWWWLGVPVLSAIALIAVFVRAPLWYDKYVIPEGYGVLELVQFIIMLIALAIAIKLLFKPFVRKRPFLLSFTIVSALCSSTTRWARLCCSAAMRAPMVIRARSTPQSNGLMMYSSAPPVSPSTIWSSESWAVSRIT